MRPELDELIMRGVRDPLLVEEALRLRALVKVLQEEQEELKNLVKEFLEETTYVPFRAVDCDQDKVEELWEKLSNIVQEKK
jgi:uncharacterized protein YlxW (UPF0749 family)